MNCLMIYNELSKKLQLHFSNTHAGSIFGVKASIEHYEEIYGKIPGERVIEVQQANIDRIRHQLGAILLRAIQLKRSSLLRSVSHH